MSGNAYYYHKRKDSGLCVQCGKPKDRPDRVYCAECRKERNEYLKIIRVRYAMRGLCVRCGIRDANPERGKTCDYCAEKARQWYRMKVYGVE